MSGVLPHPNDTPIQQGEHWLWIAATACTLIERIESLEQDRRHQLLERVAGVAQASSQHLRQGATP